MPILTGKKETAGSVILPKTYSEPKEVKETVVVNDKPFNAVTVDLAWQPVDNLTTMVDGGSWVVDYFSQVLTRDSDLSGQQLSVSGVYQQYTLIAGLEIKVTTPLSTSQNDETKTVGVEGSGTVYPFLIPNEGDMFLAEIEPGKLAMFRIRSVTKKTIFKEACYEIQYGLDNTDSVKIDDLRSKVVKTYYHHKDFLNYGANPLLIKSDAKALNDLHRLYPSLVDHYFYRFFSREYSTFLLPGQAYRIYDPFLIDFLTGIIEVTDHSLMQKLRKRNLHDDQFNHACSVWRAIGERDAFHFNTCFRNFCLASTRLYFSKPTQAGIHASGLNYVVYPLDAQRNVDHQKLLDTKAGYFEGLTPSFTQEEITPLVPAAGYFPPDDEELDPTPQEDPYTPVVMKVDPRYASVRTENLMGVPGDYQRAISPVSPKGSYIFSSQFYQGSPACSFEEMVLDHIKGQRVDIVQLNNLSKLFHAWGDLEKFYYVPILLAMMRSRFIGE